MEIFWEYARAFLCGGVLCLIGQVLIDKTKLTPAASWCSMWCPGWCWGGLGIYKYIAQFGGAGATVPLTGFGWLLAKGTAKAVSEQGVLGHSPRRHRRGGGIAAAVFFGLLAALIFKPKSKS